MEHSRSETKCYKELTRDEKIAEVLPCRVLRHHRNIKARYLLALRNNDKSSLEYFERMGDSLRVIIENTASFERAKECGFTEPQLNKYGWVRCHLETVKEIPICRSRVKIAKTPSGKFVCGVGYLTGAAGGGWMPSIWDELHNTENEAISYGLEYLKKRMEKGLEAEKTDSCGNYNRKLINETLREINRLKSPVQLELF